jgi:CubicO group peptidase (beta-lactamase class C family)
MLVLCHVSAIASPLYANIVSIVSAKPVIIMRKTDVKRVNALGILMAIFFVGCGGGGSDSSPTTTSQASPTPQNIQSILDNATSRSIDGIVVYIDKTASEPQTFASGVQNKTDSEPADPASLFKIASLSKLFIAVAATKLVNQNALGMDDSLAIWLPTLAQQIQNSESISIKHMLEHRSGIPDFDSQVGFNWQDAHQDIDDTLAFALNLPADFAPDARYEYSNTNYLLIAKVLDTALGFSHRLFIQNEILTFLGMTDTFSLLEEVDSEQLIHGYWDGTDRIMQDYAIPGGSMISTVKDVAVFMRALNTGELLSAEERQLYPYFFNHSGWVPGYQSIAQYYQDIDTVVIQFVNTTGSGSEDLASSTFADIAEFLRN